MSCILLRVGNCRNPGSHYQATLIGRRFDGYTEGDKITWRCNFGFTEKSRTIITQICSTYGFWFGSRPTCYSESINTTSLKILVPNGIHSGFECHYTSTLLKLF